MGGVEGTGGGRGRKEKRLMREERRGVQEGRGGWG